MKRILLIFCLLLLTCGVVSANPVEIFGTHTELTEGITMTQGHDKKGAILYNFKAQDGKFSRSAQLLPLKKMPANQTGNNVKTDVLLTKFVAEALSKDSTVSSTEKVRMMKLKGNEYARTALKFPIPNSSLLVNMDVIFISRTDGITMFSFVCPDSDTDYWRPLMQSISFNLP